MIPVLVQGARMPDPDALPTTLRRLTTHNAAPARDDPDFHRDMGLLVRTLEELARRT